MRSERPSSRRSGAAGPRVQPRKRFGQHFLEPAWAARVIDAIGPAPEDVFLEIGPGTGAITVGLAARVRHVTAIELDRDLAARLRARPLPNVAIVEASALGVDLAGLVRELASAAPAGQVRVAGNLPYNVASPIVVALTRIARDTGLIADATLMLQREVVDRVVAGPGSGDYGPLAIAVQLVAQGTRVLSLPPGAFRPAPQVHSTLVRLRFSSPAIPLADLPRFDSMVRTMFTKRRKTLANALMSFAHALGHPSARPVLERAGIDPGRRPETLTLEELGRLAAAFSPKSETSVVL